MSVGRLHVITDVVIQSRYSHEELAERACAGGADVVQMRDKTLGTDAFATIAARVRDICRAHGTTFIVNDYAEIARAMEADGVHVGPDDLSIGEARAIVGTRALVGASTGTLEDVVRAQDEGADYVGFGHIFATTSKNKATEPAGLDALTRVVQRTRIPVIAIGGITEANATSVLETGAWGIAVIGAVCASDDPRAATERLRAIVNAQTQ